MQYQAIRMAKMSVKVFSLAAVLLLTACSCTKDKKSSAPAPVPKETIEIPPTNTPVPRTGVPISSGTPRILGRKVLNVVPGSTTVLKIETLEKGNLDTSASDRIERLTKQITSDEKLAPEGTRAP